MIRNIVSTFVRYPAYSWILLVVIVLAGILGLFSLKRSFFPELVSHIVTVQVTYPGASPEEMEEGVVLKVEEGLKGIEGIERITSVSNENIATVTVEGQQQYDTDILLQDVKNAVDRINSFPVDAEKPVVFKQKSFDAAMSLVVTGDADLMTLKTMAERVEDEFLATGFISQISITGIPAMEISIEVPEATLLRYNLTFDEVAAAVRANNRDISAGSLKAPDEEVLIRSRAKSYTSDGIAEIILRTNEDGTVIRVGDVAILTEQFADVPNKSLYNGKNAIGITVNKLPEEDLVKITDYIREYVGEFNATNSAVQLEITSDRSDGLNQRLNLLLSNGIIGVVLVLLVLGLFMNVRLSFWVAWGIPFSFLGMFLVGYLVGITINMISLFGMILVIGILVDDGIVVGENIYSQIEKGRKGYSAAISGAMDVLPSVYTSVFTTMVAFMPFFFLEGRIGEFIQEMAVVVIACLAFSLVECTFILPSHLSHGKASTRKPPLEGVLRFLRFKLYKPLMEVVLQYKYVAFAAVIAFFMLLIGAMNGGLIKTTFFPFIESDQTTLSLVLKPGTREHVTEKVLKEMEKSVWQVNADLMDSLKLQDSLILSTRLDIGSTGAESGGHTGKLEVQFQDGDVRTVGASSLENAIREKIGRVPLAEKLTVGGRRIFGKPVSIALTGRDLTELEAAKIALKAELEGFTQLKDITDNNIVGKREIQLQIKPRAYVLGLTSNDITRQIRQGFFGEEVQRLQKGRDEVRVWVRYPEKDRVSLGKLEKMKIKTPDGRQIPFQEVADYSIGRAIVSISHFDGAREIRVEADLANQDTPVPPILEDIKNNIMPPILADYPGVRVSYEGQANESRNFSGSGAIWFPIAFITMTILLTIAFRSFWQALIIMLMIPLGVAGAAIGHGIEGKPLSLLSIYGLLALSGIIINDAVVFLHRFNQFIQEGMSIREAAMNAGISRFRAILLTTLTTVAGLYPLILETSRQAQFLIPMAISVAYGVLFGTFFLLVMFPVLILILNDIRNLIHWIWHGEWPATPEQVEWAMREKRRSEFLATAEPVAATPQGGTQDWPIEFVQGPSEEGENDALDEFLDRR